VPDPDALAAEQARITEVYARREAELAGVYSPTPGNRYVVARREEATRALLESAGLADLAGRRILEVGCGHGGELERLVAWGADPALLGGVDLLPDRVAAARARLPAADVRVADARDLPYPDGHFDLVMQVTLFSSILDPAIRVAAAAEVRRVLRPTGHVLWVDMWIVRPDRPLAAMPLAEIRRLFPGWKLDWRRAVLNPLLARRLAPLSPRACDILAKLPLLQTYNIALLTCASSS